jgi:hypothetical protein
VSVPDENPADISSAVAEDWEREVDEGWEDGVDEDLEREVDEALERKADEDVASCSLGGVAVDNMNLERCSLFSSGMKSACVLLLLLKKTYHRKSSPPTLGNALK